MRHAKRLDHVLGGGISCAGNRKLLVPQFAWQEVVEFLVEAKCRGNYVPAMTNRHERSRTNLSQPEAPDWQYIDSTA